jgi:hypothetical protein
VSAKVLRRTRSQIDKSPSKCRQTRDPKTSGQVPKRVHSLVGEVGKATGYQREETVCCVFGRRSGWHSSASWSRAQVASPSPGSGPSPGPGRTGTRTAARGTGYCEHERQKSQCMDCGTGSCEHGRRKSRCTLDCAVVQKGRPAWSTDPACGKLEAHQELGEDTRGTATSPWPCLGKWTKHTQLHPLGISSHSFFIFLFSGVLARFASAQPTTPPGTPAMACHFLKDKKTSIALRRRFQFWLLGPTARAARANIVGRPPEVRGRRGTGCRRGRRRCLKQLPLWPIIQLRFFSPCLCNSQTSQSPPRKSMGV